MTKETAKILLQVLSGLSLKPLDPGANELWVALIKAKEELTQILEPSDLPEKE